MGIYVIVRLFNQCTMSDEEYRQKMQQHEMIEMREIMKDRMYREEAGKILVPAGV
jgi:hypothetical protein